MKSSKPQHFLGLYFFLVISLCSFSSPAQVNTPPYTWIAGTWIGDGFGGISEEVWSDPASDGTVMGMFRHLSKEGQINFYEFFVLDNTGLKLKHFHPDMKGWETQEDYVFFKLIEFTKNKIILEGLTYELKSENELEIQLVLEENGKTWTEVFTMTRQ